MGIGKKLRQRRTELNLSRREVAEAIHLSTSAIANYENGVSYPKPEILVSLIQLLKVDANYLYQDYLSFSKIRTHYGQELSNEEIDSITKYRALSADGKRLVRMVIDEEYERNHGEEWVEYTCLQPGTRKRYFGFLLREGQQTVRLCKENVPDGTEFCFQVQVDGYEPVYKKYDILALKSKAAGNNEIGIFCLNGVNYIRTLSSNKTGKKLRALNVMEADIEIKPEDHFFCVGTVLGKVYGNCELCEFIPEEKQQEKK